VPEFADKPSSRFAKARFQDFPNKSKALVGANLTRFENFHKGDDKLPFENDKYDLLETWNTICDSVKKGNV